MGCGQKAWAEDEDDYADALEKVGLKGDKKYGGSLLGAGGILRGAIEKAAREGKNRDETIYEIHLAQATAQAMVSARKEIEERKLAAELKDKY